MSSYQPAGLPDVFLVGRQHDPILLRTCAELGRRGATARIVGHVEHAARLSVHMAGSEGVLVVPDRPTFLRRWSADSGSSVSAFKLNELYSHLWSAAALTRSNVLNRPQSFGHVTSFPRVLILRLWNRAPHLRHVIAPEWYRDAAVCSPTQEREPLGVNLADRAAVDSAPVRMRERMPRNGRFVRTAIVGDDAWQISDPARRVDGLDDLTRQVAQALELTFAQIVWRVDPRSTTVQIARISSDPGPDHFGRAMELACRSAAEYLTP